MLVNLSEAKTRLSELVDRACHGETIVRAKNKLPLIDLVRHKPAGRRKWGLPANTITISAISMAEIAIKTSIGKLTFDFDPCEPVARTGFELLDLAGRDARRLKPRPFRPRDPFDRMLISQSWETGIPILTQDTLFRSSDGRIA